MFINTYAKILTDFIVYFFSTSVSNFLGGGVKFIWTHA